MQMLEVSKLTIYSIGITSKPVGLPVMFSKKVLQHFIAILLQQEMQFKKIFIVTPS